MLIQHVSIPSLSTLLHQSIRCPEFSVSPDIQGFGFQLTVDLQHQIRGLYLPFIRKGDCVSSRLPGVAKIPPVNTCIGQIDVVISPMIIIPSCSTFLWRGLVSTLGLQHSVVAMSVCRWLSSMSGNEVLHFLKIKCLSVGWYFWSKMVSWFLALVIRRSRHVNQLFEWRWDQLCIIIKCFWLLFNAFKNLKSLSYIITRILFYIDC